MRRYIMAQVNFNSINSGSANYSSTQIPYFSLKNDGDEAIVRIMHDTTDSFDILSVHVVNIGGRYFKINCLRNPSDPIEACPLCETGEQLKQFIYIRLLQYIPEADGTISVRPMIWERPVRYASTLKSLMDDYGPLSDCIFKIKRRGAARSFDTTYDILFQNPAVFKSEFYPKIESGLDNYSALGKVVYNKTAEDMIEFVRTGNFPSAAASAAAKAVPKQTTPAVNSNNYAAPSQPAYAPPAVPPRAPVTTPYTPPATPSYNPANAYNPVSTPSSASNDSTAPWETPKTGFTRPVRTY